MKKSFRLKQSINKDIKVGDTVYITDGSGITSIDATGEEIYIIFPYHELTGSHKKIEDIAAIVTEVGVTDHVYTEHPLEMVYLQDAIVQIGKGLFRTPSGFVKKG